MKNGSDKLTIACDYLSKATSDLKRQNQFAQLQRHRRGNLALKATIFHRRTIRGPLRQYCSIEDRCLYLRLPLASINRVRPRIPKSFSPVKAL